MNLSGEITRIKSCILMNSKSLSHALIALSEKFVESYYHKNGRLPLCEKDENWLSPCEQGEFDENQVLWQPVKISEELSFVNVEQALELTLHPDIKTYFTTLYSEEWPMQCEEGALALLFAWNKDDFARLQENIIGHILMKQKLKQEVTIFFGLTDDDDYILTMHNQTGEIWVERVGCEPHKKVAASLLEFIEQLSPC